MHWQFSTQAGLIICSLIQFIYTNMNRSLLYKNTLMVFKYMYVYTIEPHVIPSGALVEVYIDKVGGELIMPKPWPLSHLNIKICNVFVHWRKINYVFCS